MKKVQAEMDAMRAQYQGMVAELQNKVRACKLPSLLVFCGKGVLWYLIPKWLLLLI